MAAWDGTVRSVYRNVNVPFGATALQARRAYEEAAEYALRAVLARQAAIEAVEQGSRTKRGRSSVSWRTEHDVRDVDDVAR